MSKENLILLNQFVKENDTLHGENSSVMLDILKAIEKASTTVHHTINRAGLLDVLGAAGSENVQGEEVQKMDLFANDQFIKALDECGHIAAIASEENDEIISLNNSGEYLFATDPLDGSSNIDVNISVGSIFSVFKRTEKGEVKAEEFNRYGHEQILAGYVLYGTSTVLIYTCGHGVHSFTFDPKLEVFALVNPSVKTPETGNIYSINEGNFNSLDKGIQNYVTYCKELQGNGKRTHTARFMGSLVADFHRNMLKGGVFIYPATADAPKGKLRLLYECNPIAMIAEQAGGTATWGTKRLLDIKASDIHQRTPFFTGSKEMMKKALSFLEE
jgi:fructose-1,6-bisphosphatase I